MNLSNKNIHWFFAIFTASAVYVLLLILFTPIKLKVYTNHSRHNKITMIPLGENKTDMERNIHDWLVINDPTLVILPNSKYNYSRILNGKYKFKLINRQPSLLSFNRQIKPLKIDKIFLPYRSLENNYSIYNLYTYPALPEVSFELPKLKLEYPLFRDYYSGETIPLKFPASMEMKHIIKKYPPQSSTLIQVKCTENPDFFPDVKILKSSGSINLDNMARNTIITQSSFIDSKYFSPNKYLKIEVVWQKESL